MFLDANIPFSTCDPRTLRLGEKIQQTPPGDNKSYSTTYIILHHIVALLGIKKELLFVNGLDLLKCSRVIDFLKPSDYGLEFGGGVGISNEIRHRSVLLCGALCVCILPNRTQPTIGALFPQTRLGETAQNPPYRRSFRGKSKN